MIQLRILDLRNITGATNGAGTVDASGEPEFIHSFSGIFVVHSFFVVFVFLSFILSPWYCLSFDLSPSDYSFGIVKFKIKSRPRYTITVSVPIIVIKKTKKTPPKLTQNRETKRCS